ncbi:NAD(P)-dependent oxidoreductase [Flavobacterium aurantiibacter]|uniref:Alanine dehydrogenase n=1 Tax=Flavobacterium aurantiibacter TaxID=2023067 RepID=A0A255ZPT9_9FLAO|nr:NAD(P)-dependent oxidoreductase [Flavobacterium aurantiibacter]OYQ41985.1 alanine dehydrogenase [Flavobacterium aurantiibacter]OYQ42895.1 alanine dehydrogenase [Flavobacterium aurantiibacter]
MKFGIIKERKSPPDRRAVFSPAALTQLRERYPELEFAVESSDIRVFTDEEYRNAGFEVTTDLSDCDVLFGVKEIPVDNLLPNKKYFFFSHTIKKQAHNRKLLQAVLQKDIDLYDHETLVNAENKRLIGFGRYAGIVGAYNGLRAFGLKYELFELPKAESLSCKQALEERVKRLVLPNIKIVLTGHGKVANGIEEVLQMAKIKKISVSDFLTKQYDKPVYVQLDVTDYYKRTDGKDATKADFYQNPKMYTSDFERFSKVADVYMAGHFHATQNPEILSRELLNAPTNKIKVVADVSCDVDGPIACTIKASTIADPFFGYLPYTGEEVDYRHPGAITVMSIDNLPCELPKDATEGFGEMFIENIIPAFFNNDIDGILARAQITAKGSLTQRFQYLQDYVDEGCALEKH